MIIASSVNIDQLVQRSWLGYIDSMVISWAFPNFLGRKVS
jgi:hypothetical protein